MESSSTEKAKSTLWWPEICKNSWVSLPVGCAAHHAQEGALR